MIFSFDIADIKDKQLPTRKKGPINIDWLLSLCKPLVTLNGTFEEFRDDTLRELSYNSQTIIFQKLLNDNLDNIQRRIFIDNIFDNTPLTQLFTKLEGQLRTHLFNVSEGETPIFLFNKSEFETDFDFIIFVPFALAALEDQVRALANKFKLSSTRFKIEFF